MRIDRRQALLLGLTGACGLMVGKAGAADGPRFVFSPGPEVMQGTPLTVRLEGLLAGTRVRIAAERRFGRPAGVHRSWAVFTADGQGRIDLARAAASQGTYEGVDRAGLFWSMQPTPDPLPADWKVGEVRLSASIEGKVAAEGLVRLKGFDPAVTDEAIPGFPAARLYRLPGGKPRPVVVVLHGADGNTGASERYGRKLASLGYAVVGLPYYSPDWGPAAPPKAIPDLPGSFIDIRIDQIETLRDWLKTRSDLDAGRIALFGGSKGAEFALLAASKYPWLTSVVAFAPSDVVWEGWGLEMLEAEGTRSSFSFQGKPLPFMPYKGFVDGLLAGPRADLLKIHEDGRTAHPDREAAARIRIEEFPGPVLLVAGGDDHQWKSGAMAKSLEKVRKARGRDTTLLYYPQAGHDVGGDGWIPTLGEVARGGGTAGANARAQADAWPRVLAFLKRTLKP